MATKDLSRTVIEGGRAWSNTRDRRRSNAVARMYERAYLRSVSCDRFRAEEVAPRERHQVRKYFHDRLGAAERWLRKQTGRPWRTVEGEILARFDTRTLAGRHIVFDHLLPRGFEHCPLSWRVRRHLFYVRPDGVLAVETARRTPRRPWPRPGVLDRLGDRRIVLRGSRAYWLEPAFARPDCPIRYRQGRELDRRDRAWLTSLTPVELAYATTPEISVRRRDPAHLSIVCGASLPSTGGG